MPLVLSLLFLLMRCSFAGPTTVVNHRSTPNL